MQRNGGGKRKRSCWTLADYYLSDVCEKNISLSSAAGYLSLAQRETWENSSLVSEIGLQAALKVTN